MIDPPARRGTPFPHLPEPSPHTAEYSLYRREISLQTGRQAPPFRVCPARLRRLLLFLYKIPEPAFLHLSRPHGRCAGLSARRFPYSFRIGCAPICLSVSYDVRILLFAPEPGIAGDPCAENTADCAASALIALLLGSPQYHAGSRAAKD